MGGSNRINHHENPLRLLCKHRPLPQCGKNNKKIIIVNLKECDRCPQYINRIIFGYYRKRIIFAYPKKQSNSGK
jgi:hypothetical protein